MLQLFDISHWSEQPWWNTGGTRNKKIFLNPGDNKLYYFKQSFKRDQKDYKYEFWSEILASEIGTLCGFDVLQYHPAVCNDLIGCLSKSMIDPDVEELVEGGKYIQAFDNTFNQDHRDLRYQYDFDLVMDTLEEFLLEKFERSIIEVIVFDALIGNSDRHQENWAFITEHSNLSKSLGRLVYELEHSNLSRLPKLGRRLLNWVYMMKGTQKVKPEFNKVRLLMAKSTRFAPIYDSGCSFGRELTDERVTDLLKGDDGIESYIANGKSEIHWKNKKVSHFELLEFVLADEDFSEMCRGSIERVIEKFIPAQFTQIVANVDAELPHKYASIRIPDDRKELIAKLVIARFNRLKALIEAKK